MNACDMCQRPIADDEGGWCRWCMAERDLERDMEWWAE